MQTFRIQVTKPNGETVERAVSAENREAAEQVLTALGFTIGDKPAPVSGTNPDTVTTDGKSGRLFIRPSDGARARTKDEIAQDQSIRDMAVKLGVAIGPEAIADDAENDLRLALEAWEATNGEGASD